MGVTVITDKDKKKGAENRRWSNFLLQPGIQTRLGLFSIVLSLVFSISVCFVLALSFGDLIRTILELTEAKGEMEAILKGYLFETQFWIYGLLTLYITATIGVSIWFTHRMVGPTIAFKRHLAELGKKNFHYRTTLRKGDAFSDVADALNRHSDDLVSWLGDAKSGKSR